MVYKFFDKKSALLNKSSGSGVSLMNHTINWQMNFINQLFKNLKKEKFIQFLETIFGVLI